MYLSQFYQHTELDLKILAYEWEKREDDPLHKTIYTVYLNKTVSCALSSVKSYTTIYLPTYVRSCGLVDRVLDSRSEGLGVDSQCWLCVEVSGELCISHCLGPPSRNGYLVHRSNVGSIVAGCIGTHRARGKVKSVEHAFSWSLVSKQLPSPLPATLIEKLKCQGTRSCTRIPYMYTSLLCQLIVLAKSAFHTSFPHQTVP